MHQPTREYLEGYRNALEELDVNITESIQRNHGATTLIQTLNVFNDTISSIQEQLANINSTLRRDNEKKLAEMVENTFVMITKGVK